MAENNEMEPGEPATREAEELLSEYFRIRKEYNSLDRDDPTHSERRAALKQRYYELDRQYSALVDSEEELGGIDDAAKRAKGEVLWRGAFDEGATEGLGDAEEDARWVEIQTPVEGSDSTDALFEQALQELESQETRSSDAAEHLAPPEPDSGETEGADTGLLEGVRGESLEAIAERLESEGLLTDDYAEGDSAERSGSPTLARGVSEERDAVAGRKRRWRGGTSAPTKGIRPIACPSCGETLPAGTEVCSYCHARLIGGEGTEAEAESYGPQAGLQSARREERAALGPKIVISAGWLIVLAGACWLIALGTGLAREYLSPYLESTGLEILGEEQASLIFGLAVLFLGGTLVGVGIFAGRFIRLVIPMHELARTGRVDMLEKLILQGENIDERDERGCTPLHFAVVAGQREAVSVLIGNGAELNARNDRGDTPLHMATANRDEALVKYLISKGADANAVNESGSTLMHVAAWVGDVPLMKLFLSKGVPLEPRTHVGFTPLHFAAQSGYVEAVDFLLERGANPDASSDLGTTPMFPAARNGHLPVVQRLVEAGGDVNVKRGHDFESPLGVAAAGKRREVVEYLKEQGAEI